MQSSVDRGDWPLMVRRWGAVRTRGAPGRRPLGRSRGFAAPVRDGEHAGRCVVEVTERRCLYEAFEPEEARRLVQRRSWQRSCKLREVRCDCASRPYVENEWLERSARSADGERREAHSSTAGRLVAGAVVRRVQHVLLGRVALQREFDRSLLSGRQLLRLGRWRYLRKCRPRKHSLLRRRARLWANLRQLSEPTARLRGRGVGHHLLAERADAVPRRVPGLWPVLFGAQSVLRRFRVLFGFGESRLRVRRRHAASRRLLSERRVAVFLGVRRDGDRLRFR